MGTREEAKKQRKEQIIEAAKQLFCNEGLYEVQMQHIADEAGIGIATLFRYFQKKEQLIIAVAVSVMEHYQQAIHRIVQSEGTAYEKTAQLFDFFLHVTKEPTLSYTKFKEAFESFSSFRTEPLEQIEDYIAMQEQVMEEMGELIKQGQQDGSIRKDIEIEATLVTLINSFGVFSSKIIMNEPISPAIMSLSVYKQQTILKDIFLQYLKG